MMRHALAVALLVGCAEPAQPLEANLEQDATVCGVGPTVKGIDVSYYQGSINWASVKAAGVEFAFIRVSDGTGFEDPNFDTYWAGSRANGIVHGAYQFFRPGQDVIAQADLLLSKIGNTIAADDLPPVLDVEAADGLSAAQVGAKVKQWVDHVTAALGRPPIVYTGYYFWRDSVGSLDESASPLWHAQYTSAACPLIADTWSTWAFWQYTSTGTVAGISGSVDVDRWNGDMAALTAFLGPPTPPAPCLAVPATGGTIDDSDPCFVKGGPSIGMRLVSDAGQGGGLTWTHTTDLATEQNYGQWNLSFDQPGRYHVEVYTAAAYAQSKQANYLVHTTGGDTSVTLDQTAADGWQALGDFDFGDSADQNIHLADNTGEPEANNVQLVFDAVRVTPLDYTGSGSDPGGDPGAGSDGTVDPKHSGGCAAGGPGGSFTWALLMAASCVACRRRSASRRR
jgi:GH25 family lysozyme M1 (1,4-beta-N-acetylmuramidase)